MLYSSGLFRYLLGGIVKERHKVRCLDVTGCWTQGPPMLSARLLPHAVVLDGKLYVMGGTRRRRDDSEPWAEVFDPCLRKWEPLPSPPSRLLGYCYISDAAALDTSKKILLRFHESKVIFIYNVVTRSWEESDHDQGIPCVSCYSQPVVVGDTVYWFTYGGKLLAYDFNQKMHFLCSIKGLKEEHVVKHLNDLSFFPSLLHLGGDVFCLLWSDIDLSVLLPHPHPHPHPFLDPVRCHCVKFRLSKCSGDSGSLLNAFVLSCQSYRVDHDVCFIDGYLLDVKVRDESKFEEESAYEEMVGKDEG